jgi:WD40 repeat protein
MGVSFRADNKAVATSGGDGIVNVWDMESGERKKKIIGWNKEVTALQYIGATSNIVASSGDNQIRIVSDDGTEVRAMTKLPEFMQSAASAHTANLIVAGGEDSALRVWDSSTGKELAIFNSR